jgi:hypothetical protein
MTAPVPNKATEVEKVIAGATTGTLEELHSWQIDER